MVGMRMVTVEEAYKLLKMVKQESRPLDDVVSNFNSSFPRPLRFSLCASLFLILEDKLMLSGTERLVALSILHQTYASQPPPANPFIRFFVSIAGDDKVENFERAFIVQLLELSNSSNIKEFLKQSATDYVKGFDSSLDALPQIEQ